MTYPYLKPVKNQRNVQENIDKIVQENNCAMIINLNKAKFLQVFWFRFF